MVPLLFSVEEVVRSFLGLHMELSKLVAQNAVICIGLELRLPAS